MRGVGNMHLFRDREMGKAVTGFESRTVTAHEISNKIIDECLPDLSCMYKTLFD